MRSRASTETRLPTSEERTSELQVSEQRYRALIDNANDIVATMDLDFRFTSVNPAVERILGYAPHEIVGFPLATFVPEDQLHARDYQCISASVRRPDH